MQRLRWTDLCDHGPRLKTVFFRGTAFLGREKTRIRRKCLPLGNTPEEGMPAELPETNPA